MRHIIARYIGGKDTDPYYKHKQVYPLAIRKRWFNKRIVIYKRRGFHEEPERDSQREFRDMDTFGHLFKIIKEDKK